MVDSILDACNAIAARVDALEMSRAKERIDARVDAEGKYGVTQPGKGGTGPWSVTFNGKVVDYRETFPSKAEAEAAARKYEGKK